MKSGAVYCFTFFCHFIFTPKLNWGQSLQAHLNPSFEYVIESTNIPMFWTNNTDATSDFTVFSGSENHYVGKRALCIRGTKGIGENLNWYNEKGCMVYFDMNEITDILIKEKNDSINISLSFEYMLNDKKYAYGLAGFTKIESNGELHSFSKDTLKNTNNKWVNHKAAFKLSIKDNWSKLTFLFNGDGEIWLDNIDLKINGNQVRSVKPKYPSKKDIELLNGSILKINSCNFNSTDKDISAIVNSLPDFKIIGLGESTHGTSEFQSLRARLIKELILKKGVDFVVLETNFPESYMALNKYVIDGIGSAKESLEYTLVWPWQTSEMIELLEWIRTYNLTAKRKVYLSGMDVQFNYSAAKQIKKILLEIDSNLISPVKDELDFLSNSGPYGYYDWQDKKDSCLLFENNARRLNDYLSEIFPKILDKRNTYRERALLQLSNNLLYFAEMMKSYKREYYSSLNIDWIVSNFPNAKIAVIAHTAHTMSNSSQNGTGLLLKNKYKSQYLSMCFTTAFGKYTAFDSRTNSFTADASIIPPIPESIEYLLLKGNYSSFYLPLNEVGAKIKFLSNDLSCLGIGSVVTPNQTFTIKAEESIKGCFDGIFFIRKTKGTTLNR